MIWIVLLASSRRICTEQSHGRRPSLTENFPPFQFLGKAGIHGVSLSSQLVQRSGLRSSRYDFHVMLRLPKTIIVTGVQLCQSLGWQLGELPGAPSPCRLSQSSHRTCSVMGAAQGMKWWSRAPCPSINWLNWGTPDPVKLNITVIRSSTKQKKYKERILEEREKKHLGKMQNEIPGLSLIWLLFAKYLSP